MMRTIEVLIVIIIIAGAFAAASSYAVLPWPRQVSPINLRRLSFTTLQTLDSNYDLSRAAFAVDNVTAWTGLEVALSASLPLNVLYNLTVYDVGNSNTSQLYTPLKTISNTASLGATSDAFSYTVASSSVTFNMVAEKIGENGGGGTLYILNCSDANGWWITGYTAQGLADDLYKLLSPYFMKTIMVQNTAQLQDILEGRPLQGENISNAVVVNTFGEAVPIPTAYSTSPYSDNNYTNYCYFLGNKTKCYNWTWASVGGYPFTYVSNTQKFQNGKWGIYGLYSVSQAGFNSFLKGLSGKDYLPITPDMSNWITLGEQGGNPASAQVYLSISAVDMSNYYGIYPSPNQTATRAVPSTIQSNYDLRIATSIFDPVTAGGKTWLAGTMFEHITASGEVSGKLLPIGLTRSPDIRITALGLLSYFQPRLYRSEYTAYGTSRLVVLELGLMGGV